MKVGGDPLALFIAGALGLITEQDGLAVGVGEAVLEMPAVQDPDAGHHAGPQDDGPQGGG